MKEIKFSIVCSAFNAEKYISDCMLSVLNNDYSNFEFIIIDDGSEDNTFEVCKKIAKKDPKIKIIRNNNMGPYNERINGYKMASGDYILSIDADDSFRKGAFQFLNSLIQKHNFPDFVSFNCYVFENNRQDILDSQTYPDDKVLSLNDFIKPFVSSYALNQALYRKCFKRNILENGVDLSNRNYKMFEDGLFSLKLIKSSKSFLYSNECLYNYKIENANSLTKKYSVNNISDFDVFNELNDVFHSITNDKSLLINFNSILNRFYFNKIISYAKNRSFNEFYALVKKNRKLCDKKLLKLKTPYCYMKKMYFLKVLYKLNFVWLFSKICWRSKK